MQHISARVSRVLAVFGVIISLLVLPALSPAAAKVTLPKTVPPVLQKTAKNVTADALPTVQINGVVWSQVIVGNKVFVGGSFSTARPAGAAPGTQTVSRKNLLMYSLKSGVLKSFAPELNGAVDTLAASPDGKTLYVVGQFTRVGTAKRLRFAAFSVATGKLLALAPAFNARVRGIAVTKSTVYLGGWFTAVGTKARSRLAAISATTGKVRSAWAPKADDAVYALVMTPDQTKVIVGGRFYKVNDIKGWGMASVDAKTGARKRWKINAVVRNYGTAAATMSLAVDKTTIYGTGYAYGKGNFEGTFAASPKDGTIKWLQDCHGDTYDAVPIGGVVYAVGHAHFCSNIGGFPDTPTRIGHRALAMTQQAVGTVAANTQPGAHYGNFGGQPAPALFNWFPDLAQGSFTGASQAAWSITGNSTYISLGGEFPAVNGVPQQGLVRFAIPSEAPNASGPKLTGSAIAPTVALNAQGTVAVSWLTNHDFDDRKLQYEVLRDGAVVNMVKVIAYFWNRLPVAYTDSGVAPGRTYSYQIRTTDPDGNVVLSPAVQVTTPAAAAAQQKAAEPKVGDATALEPTPSLTPAASEPTANTGPAPR